MDTPDTPNKAVYEKRAAEAVARNRQNVDVAQQITDRFTGDKSVSGAELLQVLVQLNLIPKLAPSPKPAPKAVPATPAK
jgi:hypothetical protein